MFAINLSYKYGKITFFYKIYQLDGLVEFIFHFRSPEPSVKHRLVARYVVYEDSGEQNAGLIGL